VRVVVAGGHGKIGLRLLRLLAGGGHQPLGLVRNPDHVADLADAGADAVVLDLESASVDEVRAVLDGADVTVFAAGAGPGSGAARKLTVDRDAAVLLADAAVAAGVRRYLLVSAMGAVPPGPDEDLVAPESASDEDVFALYLKAKGAADAAVAERDLDWVVVRPGGLTDDPGTGRVLLAPSVPRGSVSRDDVAAVLLAMADAPLRAVSVELVAGETPIDEAVAALPTSP
jgi:nucleoside-diphosphate-sugar epimerase